MQTALVIASALAFATSFVVAGSNSHQPIVKLQNGSYIGRYQPHFHQDLFLGLPYAQPPVGDLRLRDPLPFNATWSEPKLAIEYSPACIGFGPDTAAYGNATDEDCLTVNVIRPHDVSEDSKLPVAVWIHGGSFTNGGSRDAKYNLSYIVEQGVQMHKPFIGVSLNYRVHLFGFLWGTEVKKAGIANLGLKDQRLALHWVHDNIAKFGGDPNKVTIYGESAGSGSVGCQLLAYNGRDDHLFRGAIMQSMDVAWAAPAFANIYEFDAYYNAVVAVAGCNVATNNTLDCLRKMPIDRLRAVLSDKSLPSPRFFPVLDGEFIQDAGVEQFKRGDFVHVPLLHGQTNDEGSAFGRQGVNTEQDFINYLRMFGRTDQQIEILTKLYPDIPAIGIPTTLHGRPPPGSPLGVMYKRSAAFGGDFQMHAGRRYMGQIWAKHNITAFDYNFDAWINGMPPEAGATHFSDIGFMFYNLQGDGYSVNPFGNKPKAYTKLAKMMTRMWISFFVDQTPNHSGETELVWPEYATEDAQIMTFDPNVTKLAFVAPDTYRAEAIAYIHEMY